MACGCVPAVCLMPSSLPHNAGPFFDFRFSLPKTNPSPELITTHKQVSKSASTRLSSKRSSAKRKCKYVSPLSHSVCLRLPSNIFPVLGTQLPTSRQWGNMVALSNVGVRNIPPPSLRLTGHALFDHESLYGLALDLQQESDAHRPVKLPRQQYNLRWVVVGCCGGGEIGGCSCVDEHDCLAGSEINSVCQIHKKSQPR